MSLAVTPLLERLLSTSTASAIQGGHFTVNLEIFVVKKFRGCHKPRELNTRN